MKKEVEVVLIVLNLAVEAAYSVQAFDWSGGRCRGCRRDQVPDELLPWWLVLHLLICL